MWASRTVPQIRAEACRLSSGIGGTAPANPMILSYFNDSYFWVVPRFPGLEGAAALQGRSGIPTAVRAGSIPLLFILNLILG